MERMQRVEGRPQVVAHRGSSHVNPEHTLGAYVAALDDGPTALECDVRLTADGHLVCVHDRRVDRTANAAGVVSTMELAQLDELDFASWKNPWADLDDEAPERRPGDPPGAHPAPAAGGGRATTTGPSTSRSRPSTRPGTPGWWSAASSSCSTTFGWTGEDSPARVMSFSRVALTRVRSSRPTWRPCCSSTGSTPGSWPPACSAAETGSPDRASTCSGRTRAGRRLRRAGPTGPRLDGQHRGGPRPVRRAGRGGRDHRRPAARADHLDGTCGAPAGDDATPRVGFASRGTGGSVIRQR